MLKIRGAGWYSDGMAAKIRTTKKKKASLKGGSLKKKNFGFSASEAETLIASQRQRRLEAERRRDPRLLKAHRNAIIFLGLGVGVHVLTLVGQLSLIFSRGMAGRYEMAVHVSMMVAGTLLLLAGFAKFRKPWVPTLTALIVYLCYIPIAILIDHQTGTIYKVLMIIAVVAFLRALASAFSHRKVWREIYGVESDAGRDGRADVSADAEQAVERETKSSD